MSTETKVQATILARGATRAPQTVLVPATFNIQPIDSFKAPAPALAAAAQDPARQPQVPLARPGVPQANDLGVLTKLQGVFKGNGFNMIFRPGKDTSPSTDNFLEYNLTGESMQFLNVLDQIPNRGFGKNQPDVMLNAVPYTQMVKDFLNHDSGSGLADKPSQKDIHFEQGLFILTPPTSVPQVNKATISRLASIPHGTTINCQGVAPDMSKPNSGMPSIEDISIQPLFSGGGGPIGFQFPTTDFSKANDLRLPRDVTLFAQKGTLDTKTMLNPNKALNDVNKSLAQAGGVFKEHVVFSVSSNASKDATPLPGGGTANIGFLAGQDASSANANAVKVTCKYWISTVEYTLKLPAGDFSGANGKDKQLLTLAGDVITDATASKPTAGVGKTNLRPTFLLNLNSKIPSGASVRVITLQLQYSQNVILDFNGVSWPHVSVATLFQQGINLGDSSSLLAGANGVRR